MFDQVAHCKIFLQHIIASSARMQSISTVPSEQRPPITLYKKAQQKHLFFTSERLRESVAVRQAVQITCYALFVFGDFIHMSATRLIGPDKIRCIDTRV